MALSKRITLENGIETGYHIVYALETIDKSAIRVLLYSFKNKSIYETAMNKNKYTNEQTTLIDELEELNYKEELTKSEENKLKKLHEQINNLADKINECKEFREYILAEQVIVLSYSEDLSLDYIENELIKLDKFKSAKIV
jgi:hypothetical protein